jgi:hypothetical protein
MVHVEQEASFTPAGTGNVDEQVHASGEDLLRNQSCMACSYTLKPHHLSRMSL